MEAFNSHIAGLSQLCARDRIYSGAPKPMMAGNPRPNWYGDIPELITKTAGAHALGELRLVCREAGRRRTYSGRDYYFFDNGFVYSRTIFGLLRVRQVAHRWDEIQAIVFNMAKRWRTSPGADDRGRQYAIIVDLTFTNGRAFRGKCWAWLSAHDTSVYRFIADKIAEAQGPRIWEAFLAGHAIAFGRAVANREGLRYGDRLFPWARVKDISFPSKEDNVRSWADDLVLTVTPGDQICGEGMPDEERVRIPSTDFANIEALRRLHARVKVAPGSTPGDARQNWGDDIPEPIAKAAGTHTLGKLCSICREHGPSDWHPSARKRRRHAYSGRDYYFFENGFVYSRTIFGLLRARQVQVAHRWDEVQTIVFNMTTRWRTAPAVYSTALQYAIIADLTFTDGKAFRGECWAWLRDHRTSIYRFVANKIAEAQGPRLWEAYLAGHAIAFGRAVANREGLRYADRLFPWARVEDISFPLEERDVRSWADDLVLTVAPGHQKRGKREPHERVKLPSTDFANIEALRRLHARIKSAPGSV